MLHNPGVDLTWLILYTACQCDTWRKKWNQNLIFNINLHEKKNRVKCRDQCGQGNNFWLIPFPHPIYVCSKLWSKKANYHCKWAEVHLYNDYWVTFYDFITRNAYSLPFAAFLNIHPCKNHESKLFKFLDQSKWLYFLHISYYAYNMIPQPCQSFCNLPV